jgi:N-carbamoyl-L-amino-acid hydrolase
MTSGSTFEPLWASLLSVGQDRATAGYRHLAWSDADLEARAWFSQRACERGLEVEADRNGNLWPWLGAAAEPRSDTVRVGSHLDSVWDGGAFDGALGVVSGLAAVDLLRSRGFRPHRPIAICVCADEEDSHFGAPCLGSRLLTGALDAASTRSLVDPQGLSVEQAMRAAGLDPSQPAEPSDEDLGTADVRLDGVLGQTPIAQRSLELAELAEEFVGAPVLNSAVRASDHQAPTLADRELATTAGISPPYRRVAKSCCSSSNDE